MLHPHVFISSCLASHFLSFFFKAVFFICLLVSSQPLFFLMSLSLYQCLVCPGMAKVNDMPVLMSHLSQWVTVLLSHQPWGIFREITVLCMPPRPICRFTPPDVFFSPLPQTLFHWITHEVDHFLTAPHTDSPWFMLAIKCTRQNQRFGTDGWEEDSNVCKYLDPLKPACTLL